MSKGIPSMRNEKQHVARESSAEHASKGERTRQHIIAEAAPLFNQRGFEGCSMQEVMIASGLEKGGIYRHFATKEELALSAFDHAWSIVSAERTRGLEHIGDPLLRVETFIRNFVERRPNLPGGCPLLNTAVDADDGNIALRARAREAVQGWYGGMVDLLQDAQRQNLLKREANPRMIASIIISTLEGAVMLSRLEDRTALEFARDHLLAYLDGMRAGPPAERRGTPRRRKRRGRGVHRPA
jgi:TetR/AcrR family transcriptional regulator, transcriptional repressor for nem operon